MAQSLLFSASMRQLISHKKHKFPIKNTNNEHEKHLNLNENINYDMYRTDTTNTMSAQKTSSTNSSINGSVVDTHSNSKNGDDSNTDSHSNNANHPNPENQKDPNLWLDSDAETKYGWNVGIIMRIHHKKNKNAKLTFTEYMADELGYNYDDYLDYGG
eukprot:167594_1